MKGRLLVVDDDQSMCEMLEAYLGRRGFVLTCYGTADEAFTALMEHDYDVLLTDLNLPGMNGIELCSRVISNKPDLPVMVITAFGSLETAISAIRAGAYDFVTKPVDMDVLALALERAVKHSALQQKVRLLNEAVKQSQTFEELIGSSPPMLELFAQLARISDTDTAVLITGESGTGKELVARALHRQSRRSSGPFVAINCAALPAPLLESELFGHTQGAFTDAKLTRKGLFLQADKGTLLLDEIADFPMPLQPKLLRVLEERRMRPVGSDSELALDFRVLSATNRDLESAVEEGRFREDLFYRLNVIQVDVPPLRARGADSLLLAQHFLDLFSARSGKTIQGLGKGAAERLLSYGWPGNVRELRNAVERAVALTRHDQLVVEDLPERIRAYRGPHVVIGGNNPSELISLEEVDRRYILHVMDAVSGNRTLAARILGLDRKTLYRKLKRYGSD